MIITVDIGNSNINFAVFNNEFLNCENIDNLLQSIKPIKTFQISSKESKSSDEYALMIYSIFKINKLDMQEIKGSIISSVVPQLTQVIFNALKNLTKAYIYTVGVGIKTGLKINALQLGSDIVANCVAVNALSNNSTVILDFGTATTVTLIENPVTVSGVAIMPGVELSLQSLAKGTALLGYISLAKNKNITLGQNTQDSIIAGILGNFAFSVDGFIEKIKNDLKTENIDVIATGDWCEYIIPHCKTRCKITKNLTALGLLKLYIINNQKRNF